MTIFAATDYTISFNSVDLTDHCTSISVDFDAAELPTTAFGQDWMESITGLKSGNLTAAFNQDFASSSVDATLWAAFSAGVAVPVIAKPTSGAVSATNPSFTFNVLVTAYSPIGAGVGDLASTSPSFKITGAATRNVS
jgi:hypothetical protein